MPDTTTELLLGQIPLFERCGRRELRHLAALCSEVAFEAGEALTRQSSPGREFFVIISGTASVDRDGEVINTLGAGSPVGELALLDGAPRTATVTATSRVRAVVLSAGEFWDAIASSPGLDRALLTTMAARLRATLVALDGHGPL